MLHDRTTARLLCGAAVGAAGAAIGATIGAAVATRRPWIDGSGLSRAIPIETDPLSEIPESADVVVIGGGISGISTALFLNEFGLKTVVFEKGVVGGEASSRNFGWVYTNGLHPDRLELAVAAKRIWLGLGERFGHDITVRQGGNTLLLDSEEELQQMAEWVRVAREMHPDDIDAEILRGDALDRIVGSRAGSVAGALHQASDGSAEPTHAVPLIAKGARAEGVQVFAPVAVRGIETAGGAVHSVVTELGEVRTPRVVVAGGSWSRLFLGNLGIDLPQQAIASSLLRVEGGTAAPGAGFGAAASWREQVDGSYSIGVQKHIVPATFDSLRMLRAFAPSLKQQFFSGEGSPLKVRVGSDLLRELRTRRSWRNDEVTPFEETRVLTARHSTALANESLADTQALFPRLAGTRVVERWAGVLDATPDSTSVISEIASIPGLLVNTGHTSQGFTLGPATGLLAAELVSGRKPSVDPWMYRFSRFSDGSRLTVLDFI